MDHGSSPGTRPLVVDVCSDPCDPEAAQPVLVRAPPVPLGLVRTHPAPRLGSLCVRHVGRQDWNERLARQVRHVVDVVDVADGDDITEV